MTFLTNNPPPAPAPVPAPEVVPGSIYDAPVSDDAVIEEPPKKRRSAS